MSLTVILRPNGMGAYSYSDNVKQGWHYNDGLAYAQIDEEELSDADYWGIYTNTTNSGGNRIRKSFTLPDVSLSGIIESVAVYFRVSGDNSYSMIPFVYTHTDIYYGAQVVPTPENSNITYSASWATNPNTGIAWTWEEINALEPGIELYSAGYSGNAYSDAKNYWLYVVVTYRGLGCPRAQIIGMW